MKWQGVEKGTKTGLDERWLRNVVQWSVVEWNEVQYGMEFSVEWNEVECGLEFSVDWNEVQCGMK